MRRLAPKSVSVVASPFRKPLGLLNLFRRDRVCPRITEAESGSGLLGGDLGGRLNDRAKWIANLASILTVGVIDAPKLIAWSQCRVAFHAGSSPQPAPPKMYQLHKMHEQSADCPMLGLGMANRSPPPHHCFRTTDRKLAIPPTLTRSFILLALSRAESCMPWSSKTNPRR